MLMNRVSVKLGGYDDGHPHTQIIPVERTYANPGYKGKQNDYQNDIGLIKLKYPADLSDGECFSVTLKRIFM
jgi:hypothetical protein